MSELIPNLKAEEIVHSPNECSPDILYTDKQTLFFWWNIWTWSLILNWKHYDLFSVEYFSSLTSEVVNCKEKSPNNIWQFGGSLKLHSGIFPVHCNFTLWLSCSGKCLLPALNHRLTVLVQLSYVSPFAECSKILGYLYLNFSVNYFLNIYKAEWQYYL